jgi:hypothetical protein
MAVEQDSGRMGRQALGRIFSHNDRVAGGLVGARDKTHFGEQILEPCRSVAASPIEGGVRPHAWKSQQLEQARNAFVQGVVDALQNIVKTFHLQEPETLSPV